MAELLSPGVYVIEESSGIKPIEGVGTATAAFVGIAGHMGSRFLFFLNAIIKNKGINVKIQLPEDPQDKDK